MAVSKKAQRAAAWQRPDPAPFQAILNQGVAELDDVLDAYEFVLRKWVANGGQADPRDLVPERPVIDVAAPTTLDGLLIQRNRDRHFRR